MVSVFIYTHTPEPSAFNPLKLIESRLVLFDSGVCKQAHVVLRGRGWKNNLIYKMQMSTELYFSNY